MRYGLNFHYNFHAVGQGLFAGGLLSPHPGAPRFHSHGKRFRWVYDCGSLNRRPLQREIRLWKRWPEHLNSASPLPLDLMVLSHFDSDHINGLRSLLAGRTVDWLVLPYLTPGERLLIGVLTNGDRLDADFLHFLTDPVGYLAGGEMEIRHIVFISPGGELPSPPSPEKPVPMPEDLSGSFGEIPSVSHDRYRNDPSIVPSDDRPAGNPRHAHPSVHVIDGGRPFYVGGLWEFCFCNPVHTDRAGELWKLVRGDYLGFFRQDHAKRDYGAFIWKLKLAYAQVFGRHGSQRNDISLVMYTGPVGSCPPVRMLWSPWSSGNPALYYPDVLPVDNAGLLYCGDINMSHEVREVLEAHFGPSRWTRVEILQVPHHGSRHSWEVKCPKPWPQRWSVFSSARVSRFRHPAKTVVNDLARNSPIFVNELQGAHWGGIVAWA